MKRSVERVAVCACALWAAAVGGLHGAGEAAAPWPSFGGAVWLADGGPKVTGAFFVKPDGTVYAAATEATETHREGGTVRLSYPWGEVAVTAAPKPDRLDLATTVTLADGLDTLAALYVQYGALRFPAEVKLENRAWLFYTSGSAAHNLGGPGVLGVLWGDKTLAFCNEQVVRPLAFGLGAPDAADPNVRPVVSYTGRHPMARERYPWIDRPVQPGGSDRYALSLRFGEGSALNALTADLYVRYGQAYPYELKWEDRRPIGRAFVSTSPREGFPPPGNKRGWFNEAKVDVTTEAGLADFRTRLSAYADTCVRILRENDAQGIIVWDIEGQEQPHQISYLGDPRSLPPEIEPEVDAFFQKFRDAGLRTGITLRPQRPLRPVYGEQVIQVGFTDRRDRFANLADKIKRAKERWGCTLFYLDSDVEWVGDPVAIPGAAGHSALKDAQLMADLLRAFPDTLFMPEWEDLRTYAYSAPYTQLNYNKLVEPPDYVRLAYPQSFFVNQCEGAARETQTEPLIGAVRAGNILYIEAWYGSPGNTYVCDLYRRAKE